MPIFGEASTQYDELVEKVTAETLTTENWVLMMFICDDVITKGQKAYKQCMTSVKKRLNHRDPHVVLLALSLLDCLWNNCGDLFRREVSSKEFISELNYKATSSNRVVGERTRELIKKWSENECKRDTSLSLVESLYKSLLADGHSFESTSSEKKKITFPNDPNVVTSEQEEADIAKAIALSLNDVKETNRKPTQQMYPSTNNGTTNSVKLQNNDSGQRAQRQAKALYDFEAAEDNELSFVTGELITVLDDSDKNWWRGSSARGSGLFPASFVTSDLNATTDIPATVNNVKDNTQQRQQQLDNQVSKVEINEDILLKCFQLLQDCDPTGEIPDPPELAYYEQMSLAQSTLIDQKLTQIDKQHNMLAQVDVAIRDVLANYDNAVQQVQYQIQQVYMPPNVSVPMQGSFPASNLPPAQISTAPSQYQVQPQQLQQPPQATFPNEVQK